MERGDICKVVDATDELLAQGVAGSVWGSGGGWLSVADADL